MLPIDTEHQIIRPASHPYEPSSFVNAAAFERRPVFLVKESVMPHFSDYYERLVSAPELSL